MSEKPMNKKTVLIVEDEAIVAADLAGKLGQLGYEVVGIVARGDEAVASAARLQPGVVLMDIRLQGPMDGIEAAEAIRGVSDVPVIYLTAHSDAATLARAKLSEPFGYILKPFEERELTTIIEIALHKHQADSEKRRSQEALRKAHEDLERRNAELQAVNESLRSSRVAALNLMEDAVTARKQAEKASLDLRESEERYRNLFNTMDEGFCIVEMIFDTEGRPVDYRFLEINPAFEKQTGLLDAKGKLMRELAPAHEAHWFEIYGKIALTGEPARFVNEARALNRWYEVYAYRVGRSEDRYVAILFNDISERKRAEAVTGHLAALVESADDAIISKDLNGVIQSWNIGAENMFGYTAAEAVGRNVSFLFPQGYEDDTMEIIGRIVKGEHIDHFESARLRKDATIVPVSLTYSAIRDARGKVIGISKIAHDITERKQAEEALRESELRLKRAQEISHLGSWELDVVNNILTWSDEVYRIFGLRPQEFGATYEAFLEAVHPDDRLAVDQAYSGSLREGRDTYEIEHRVVRKSGGEIRYVHEKCDHLRDVSGNIIRSVGMVHDITERKRAEEALRRLNEDLEKKVVERTRFYSIRAKISEAIVRVSDRQALFDEVCRVVVETGGFRLAWVGVLDPETREVRPVASFGASAYLEGIRIIAADVAEGKGPTGRAVYEDHCVMNTDFEKDVLLLPWRDRARAHSLRSSSAVPLHTGGRVIGALTIYSDTPHFFTDEEMSLLLSLSEDISFSLDAMEGRGRRAAAEEALRVLNEELDLRVQKRTADLQAVNKELEAFIYSVSHDLRAPIRSMSGFAKFLAEDCVETLDAQGKDYVRRIEGGAAKMTRIIDDLLYLSRITRQEINRTQIDLSALASSVVSELRAADPGSGAEVTVADGITAFADRRLMEVVLSNLLGNAWKFTAKTENARIEFGALEQEGKMVYYVSDNGAGFDPNYREKMFLPFQRLHSDREFEGMGIGLAIVERVIHRHAGRVWAEGQKEKGATIYFTLGEV